MFIVWTSNVIPTRNLFFPQDAAPSFGIKLNKRVKSDGKFLMPYKQHFKNVQRAGNANSKTGLLIEGKSTIKHGCSLK